jgi:hypothetical protein
MVQNFNDLPLLLASTAEFVANLEPWFIFAGLCIPVLIAIVGRSLIAVLATLLLSSVPFILVKEASMGLPAVAFAASLGSLLVAVSGVVSAARLRSLNRQLIDLTQRVSHLEAAEERRILVQLGRGGAPSLHSPTSATVKQAAETVGP